jgi:hypothetical protein
LKIVVENCIFSNDRETFINSLKMSATSKKLKLGIGSLNDHVETPTDLYNTLNKEFKFKFDPCPLHSKFDGLQTKWKKSNFINPPYSDISPWLEKAVEEMNNGNLSVFLIPVRTQTKYWHKFVFPHVSEMRFIQTGVKFKGYSTVLPNATCILIFNPKKIQQKKLKKSKKYGEYETFNVKMK